MRSRRQAGRRQAGDVRLTILTTLAALTSLAWLAATPAPAQAQSAQAQPGDAARRRPDDTPSVRVGATIYADFSFQESPETFDTDGNRIHPDAFNVARSYVNITGSLSHIVAFRITPDVVRESQLVTPGTSGSVPNDSLVFRLKYAYGQFNLDDWMTKGSYVRLGIQQTPLLDYEENIYRYRFQGTTFTEREGYYNSADAGVSFHYNLPSDFGDLHVGVYDGEGYTRTDPNDQKAVEIRGSVRPFAKQQKALLHGLRLTGFLFGDHYVKSAERTRAVGQVTFESSHLNAGFDAISAHDQASLRTVDTGSSGWSWWATPRKPLENGASLEALLRYDHLRPDTGLDANRTRTIVGFAYWLPHQGAVTSALMVDYDGQTFHNYATAPVAQKRIAVHGLINF